MDGYNTNRKNLSLLQEDREVLSGDVDSMFYIFPLQSLVIKEQYIFIQYEYLKVLPVLLKKPSALGRLVVATGAKNTLLQTCNRPKRGETKFNKCIVNK